MSIRQWGIYWIDFPKNPQSKLQGGIRPAIVYSNDKCNNYSPVLTVIPMTHTHNNLPTHLHLNEYTAKLHGLDGSTTILGESICPVDRGRIKENIGFISDADIRESIHCIIDVQFGRNAENEIVRLIKKLGLQSFNNVIAAALKGNGNFAA